MKKSEKIEVVARELTCFHFALFLNPENRGKNFRFDTYNIGKFIRNTIFSNFEEALSEKELDIAQNQAEEMWSNLLESSEICDWIIYEQPEIERVED